MGLWKRPRVADTTTNLVLGILMMNQGIYWDLLEGLRLGI